MTSTAGGSRDIGLDFTASRVIDLSTDDGFFFSGSIGRLMRGKGDGPWQTTGTAFGIAGLTESVIFVSAHHCLEWAVETPRTTSSQ